jgi:hypothetical protein
VVVHKIIAGKRRDIEDGRSVLLKNPAYDHGYIIRWLKEFEQLLQEDFPGTFHTIVEEIT